jgi:acyl-CoA synthetase (AMP-forming)/AMP-acid ligase II
VACGRTLEGEHIAIVDPQDRERLQAESIGEIWVRGPHVAKGYFGRKELSEATFRARIAGEEGEWLRTSDLGFVDADGNLFVVGRIKDLIIIRGANHHPQDIERTVEECHPALSRHGGAAFSVEGDRGEERLVVVQELERAQSRGRDLEEIEDCIREAVAETHDVSPHRIVLIRPGSLPKTTSGKIQRALTRRLFLEGRLELAESAAPTKGASL